jgi:hypothetical protein
VFPVGEKEDLASGCAQAGEEARQARITAHVARQVANRSALQLRRVPVNVVNRGPEVLSSHKSVAESYSTMWYLLSTDAPMRRKQYCAANTTTLAGQSDYLLTVLSSLSLPSSPQYSTSVLTY